MGRQMNDFWKVSLKSFRIKEYQEEYGDRAGKSGFLLLLPQLRDRQVPLLYLLLTPQTTFPRGPTRRWQQQLPAKSLTQEIKGTKGMCWQDWHPCPLRVKWLSCSPRFKEHFISQQKYS